MTALLLPQRSTGRILVANEFPYLVPMHNPPLVLVVDDDKDFQNVLVAKLAANGFEVVTADDGKEGMGKARSIKPDIILMDVKMPGEDGVGALLKLREDEELRDIKVVLMTAFGDPQPEIYRNDQRFARELGAFEYFLKTQDLDEIVTKVKAMVGVSS